jgi:hypothetical protein
MRVGSCSDSPMMIGSGESRAFDGWLLNHLPRGG